MSGVCYMFLRTKAVFFIFILYAICLGMSAQQVTTYSAKQTGNRYEFNLDLSSLDLGVKYDIFIFVRDNGAAAWEKITALGGDYLQIYNKKDALILWEPIMELKEVKPYEFAVYALDTGLANSQYVSSYKYQSTAQLGFISLKSNIKETVYRIGTYAKEYSGAQPIVVPVGKWNVLAKNKNGVQTLDRDLTVSPFQIAQYKFSFETGNTSDFRSQQIYFAKYMNSAFLLPVTFYGFLKTDPAVSYLKGVSFCLKKSTGTSFEYQNKLKPSMMFGLGFLDNAMLLQGYTHGVKKIGMSVDYLAANAGFIVPVTKYRGYLGLGGHAALSYQSAVFPEYTLNGTTYSFVNKFDSSTTGNRMIWHSSPISYSADGYAKIGVKITKSWYLSGSLGLRWVNWMSGQWYRKNEVQEWVDEAMYSIPSPVSVSGLPSTNALLMGTSLYFNLALSPYF